MNGDAIGILTGLAGLAVAIGAWLNGRGANRNTAALNTSTASNDLIDQLQEERKEDRAERDDLRRRVTALEDERAIDREHIELLIDHINQRLGPPAPARPTHPGRS